MGNPWVTLEFTHTHGTHAWVCTHGYGYVFSWVWVWVGSQTPMGLPMQFPSHGEYWPHWLSDCSYIDRGFLYIVSLSRVVTSYLVGCRATTGVRTDINIAK